MWYIYPRTTCATILTKNEPAYLKEVCRLENQIIELCYDNGEEREALHFIVVLTDEILAYYDTIQKDIDNVLRDNHYNRSLAYLPSNKLI